MNPKKRRLGYQTWLAALVMSAWLPVAGAMQAPGWIKMADDSEYDAGADRSVTFGGRPSGYLKSKNPTSQGMGSYIQIFDAADYRGKRMRFSAVVKTENVEDWAGLWMRVDATEKIAAFDNMQNRPIRGTQAWAKHSLVLDVDSKAVNIRVGILLTGRGAVWINDARFEEVGADVPVTDMMRSTLPVGGVVIASGWMRSGSNPRDYDMGTDSPVVFSGRSSVYIRSNKPNPQGIGSYLQMFDATAFRGKRMAISAFARSENVEGSAGLWMQVV